MKVLKNAWDEYAFGCYAAGAHGKSLKPSILGFVWTWSKYWVLYLRCRYFGHRWESDDFASPDSGYMGVTCTRCGESHGQWLY